MIYIYFPTYFGTVFLCIIILYNLNKMEFHTGMNVSKKKNN